MHTGVLEWCLDWFGAYPGGPQTDPVEPATGIAKVVRGGGYDTRGPVGPQGQVYPGEVDYFARSSNRASMAPALATSTVASKTGKGPGLHPIGFRVVQSELPKTKPTPYEPPFAHVAVKQSTDGVLQGPDPSKPLQDAAAVSQPAGPVDA